MILRGKVIPQSRLIIHGILAALSILLMITHFWVWILIQLLFFAIVTTAIINLPDSLEDSHTVVIANIFFHSAIFILITVSISITNFDKAGEVIDDLLKGFEDANKDPADCDHTRTEKTWDGYLKCKSCGETLD